MKSDQLKTAIQLTLLALISSLSLHAFAQNEPAKSSAGNQCYVISADRVFDGFDLHENASVLIKGNKIVQVGAPDQLSGLCSRKMKL